MEVQWSNVVVAGQNSRPPESTSIGEQLNQMTPKVLVSQFRDMYLATLQDVSRRKPAGIGHDKPASDPLSKRVIHIKFAVASRGSSMTAVPISIALLLTAVMKKESSRVGSSIMTTWGWIKVCMCSKLAITLTSMRKSELQRE